MDTFPLFLTVKDQPLLLIGNGETAAQKLRLLSKTSGALFFSREHRGPLHPELSEAIEAGTLQDLGLFRGWHLRGKVFAYAGLEGDTFARRVARAAAWRRVPINIVDRPALCDFYTPSLIDRGHLTVAIGTDGQAPVMGRRVKSLIESLLPQSLRDAVQFLSKTRSAQVALPMRERRDRLDAFAKAALLGATDFGCLWQQSPRSGTAEVLTLPHASAGPSTLTLAALQALQTADTLLLEDESLIPILEYARRDGERDELSAQNILDARAHGKRVVAILSSEAPAWLTKISHTCIAHVRPAPSSDQRMAV